MLLEIDTPEAQIELGGVLRVLKFTQAGCRRAEAESGLTLMGVDAGGTAAEFRALVLAAVLHRSPDATLEEVGSWIDPSNWRDVFETLLKIQPGAWPSKPGPDRGAA